VLCFCDAALRFIHIGCSARGMCLNLPTCCLQMETRVFSPVDGSADLQLFRLLDMADHNNDCPHNYEVDICSSALAGKRGSCRKG
jgi:hypothetical protein